MLDKDQLIGRSVFAAVLFLLVFGLILVANSTSANIIGLAKAVAGIAMMISGIVIAVKYHRGSWPKP